MKYSLGKNPTPQRKHFSAFNKEVSRKCSKEWLPRKIAKFQVKTCDNVLFKRSLKFLACDFAKKGDF